jgi:DNA-binding transcriptional MerR regulator
MRIGELASRAGVNIQTIRFYERRRLLGQPPRTPSGYRSYSQTDFEALQFIRWAQQLGFTLKEVKQLLQLHTAVANLPSAHTRRDPVELDSIIKMAEEKLAAVRAATTAGASLPSLQASRQVSSARLIFAL